jgi:hypothetical protein
MITVVAAILMCIAKLIEIDINYKALSGLVMLFALGDILYMIVTCVEQKE